MKKYILIICLCSLQVACSAQSVVADGRGSLLSYSDLANEISVAYRDISTGNAPAPGDELGGAP